MATVRFYLSVNVGDGYESYGFDVDQERAEHHVEDVAENLVGLLKELIYAAYVKHKEKENQKEEEETEQ